jgi:hypothetical protein
MEVAIDILRYFPGGTEEYHEQSKLLEPVLRAKFQPVTSQIRSRTDKSNPSVTEFYTYMCLEITFDIEC